MRWGNKSKIAANLFHFADFKESFQNFLVPEFGVSENSASTLYGLDNLVAHIAGETKTRRVGENFHGTTQGLLRAWCHTYCI